MEPLNPPPAAPTWAPQNPDNLSRAPLETTPAPLDPDRISWRGDGVVFTTIQEPADYAFPTPLVDLGSRRSLDLRTSFLNAIRREQVSLEPAREGEPGLRVEIAIAVTVHLQCRLLGSTTEVVLRIGGRNCEELLPALTALENELQLREDLDLPFTLKRERGTNHFVLIEGLAR